MLLVQAGTALFSVLPVRGENTGTSTSVLQDQGMCVCFFGVPRDATGRTRALAGPESSFFWSPNHGSVGLFSLDFFHDSDNLDYYSIG